MIRRRGHPVTSRYPNNPVGCQRRCMPPGRPAPRQSPLPWWLRILSRLPLWILYACTAAGTWVMRRAVRHRAQTVRTNIERSFPHASACDLRRIESRYYANLSQVVAEVIKIPSLDRPAAAAARQLPQSAADSGGDRRRSSALVVCAHQCNWEWQLLALSAQLQVPVQAAYKPLRGTRGERLMRSLRSRFGAELVPAKALLGSLLRRRDPRAHRHGGRSGPGQQ
ncbi:MAG: hypothetical protein WDM77_01235 [Steroidobacteraceae bacterium]